MVVGWAAGHGDFERAAQRRAPLGPHSSRYRRAGILARNPFSNAWTLAAMVGLVVEHVHHPERLGRNKNSRGVPANQVIGAARNAAVTVSAQSTISRSVRTRSADNSSKSSMKLALLSRG